LVILGSGWAGYRMLQKIDTTKYNTCLVSPRNHFLFTPLLASSSVGGSDINSICQGVRPLAAKQNARFYEARAKALDKENKIVECETLDGRPFPLPYDKLVISVGYQANDFGIPDLDKIAFFMKETGDAKRLHDHILRCFEEASFIHMLDGDETLSKDEEDQIREVLSFVVVGGGPTGTEFCGELSDFLYGDIAREYPHLKNLWTIHIIDALPKLLGPFQNDAISEHAKNHLESRKIQVHLQEFVAKVEPNLISLKSGKSFPFSTLIWCAGIKPIKFTAGLDLAKNERKTQILTDKRLRVYETNQDGSINYDKVEKDIYAIGDCATIHDNWLPQTAQVANQQALYLTTQLNKLAGSTTAEKSTTSTMANSMEYPFFEQHDKGAMAYLGGTSAVYKVPAEASQIVQFISGRLGYFTWRSVYWSMQLSWRNRIFLGWNWISNFLLGRHLTRVGKRSSPVDKPVEVLAKQVSKKTTA